MRLLLDTCTFLWEATNPRRVPDSIRKLFTDPDNELYLSAVSSWEIAVKHSQGRLPLPAPPEKFIPDSRRAYGLESLPLDEETVLHVGRLPKLHADPFDRMLICQAIVHGLAILTPDPLITQYPVRVLW